MEYSREKKHKKMRTICLFIGITLSLFACVSCHTATSSIGYTYDIEDKSRYTGKVSFLDDRLFVVGDICNVNPIDYTIPPPRKYVLVDFNIHVHNIYVHNKVCRYILSAPGFFSLLPPSQLLTDTIKVVMKCEKKMKIRDYKNSLIGINKDFYFGIQGDSCLNFWDEANASFISPYPMYLLDSLVSYDSVYIMWRRTGTSLNGDN